MARRGERPRSGLVGCLTILITRTAERDSTHRTPHSVRWFKLSNLTISTDTAKPNPIGCVAGGSSRFGQASISALRGFLKQ